MAKVEKPMWGIQYWKPGKIKRTTWFATMEAQDRKAQALKSRGYHVLKMSR